METDEGVLIQLIVDHLLDLHSHYQRQDLEEFTALYQNLGWYLFALEDPLIFVTDRGKVTLGTLGQISLSIQSRKRYWAKKGAGHGAVGD